MNLKYFIEDIKNSIIKDKDIKIKQPSQIEIDTKNDNNNEQIIDKSKIRLEIEPVTSQIESSQEERLEERLKRLGFILIAFGLPPIFFGIDYFDFIKNVQLIPWIPRVVIAVIIFSSFWYAKKIYSIHDFEGDSKKMNPYARLNGQWLYFLTSFIGWSLLYYFLIVRLPNIINGINWQWEDFLIIAIVLFGIGGILSPQIISFIGAIIGIIKKTLNL